MANPTKPLFDLDDDARASGPVFVGADDWPGEGPIDLNVHDAPHASSTLEWWYVNAHLLLEGGRRVAVFAAFFRHLASDGGEQEGRTYTHSVAWGLSLIDDRRHVSKVAVDALAAEVGLRNLESTARHDDERVRRAFRDVLSRGKIPGPTRMFQTAPRVAEQRLDLDYGGDALTKLSDGRYRLTLEDTASGAACELVFELAKRPVRYGENGVVHGVTGERMFYYFVPRAVVRGSVSVDGVARAVTSGTGWYDHEFGYLASRPPAQNDVSGGERSETCWRWLSLQLDDDSELSVFLITRRTTGEVLDNWTMWVHPDGRSSVLRDATIETIETWRSTRTFIEYPIGMRLCVPSAGLDLVARATFPDQEVITIISEPAFWEGSVTVVGTQGARRLTGRGWLECKGFGHGTLDDFYSAVGREVRARVREVLPLEPSPADTERLMVRGSLPGASVSSNPKVDATRLVTSLIHPIREIVDRGGKGWRSYAALACIDVVGGDSRKFLHWLAMPEILHVGSLIVDDVEDESTVRRGGPTSHVLYGTARAINAGTAAYFLAEPPLDQDDLPPHTKLRIYRLYFDALRAGHAGQALDLEDVTTLTRRAVVSGDTRDLESHVLSVHRLKTAVPAGMFARAGALLGGGTDLQVEQLGAFFEAVGLAFQIIDDVLNVRGFERDLKQRGEDIAQGKVTLPIVKAIARLPLDERTWLGQALTARPGQGASIEAITDLLVRCGALDACTALAQRIVEEAWAELDPVIDDSQFKLMFRAFSWYVLERHY